MKKLQILGTGCAKCSKLEELTRNAAEESGIDFEIEKVQDINKIMDFGVMITPALAVNGEVKSSGRLPTAQEIKKYITE